MLAIDAFCSDAIPAHLLTTEATTLYRKHLRRGGMIAVHVSNRYLDVVVMAETVANAEQLVALTIRDAGIDGSRVQPSQWVLLTEAAETFDAMAFDLPVRPAMPSTPLTPQRQASLWADDFNNLVDVLK